MNDEWDIYMKHALWDAGLDGPKSAEHGDIMNTVRRLIAEARAAETARADAAEARAARYRELLTQVVTVRFGRQYKALEDEIRQALASADGDVSKNGENLDTTVASYRNSVPDGEGER